ARPGAVAAPQPVEPAGSGPDAELRLGAVELRSAVAAGPLLDAAGLRPAAAGPGFGVAVAPQLAVDAELRLAAAEFRLGAAELRPGAVAGPVLGAVGLRLVAAVALPLAVAGPRPAAAALALAAAALLLVAAAERP